MFFNILQDNNRIYNYPYPIVSTFFGMQEVIPEYIRTIAWREVCRLRTKRSDRIEREMRVLEFMVLHYDIATQQVVRFTKDGIKIHATNEWIAKQVGVSRTTFYDILRNLKQIGLVITSSQLYKKVILSHGNGIRFLFMSKAKSVTDKLFDLVGTLKTLYDYQEWLKSQPVPKQEPLPQYREKILQKKVHRLEPPPLETPLPLSAYLKKEKSDDTEGFLTLPKLIFSVDRGISCFQNELDKRLEAKGITLAEARKLFQIPDPNTPKEEPVRWCDLYTEEEMNSYSMEYIHEKCKEGDLKFQRMYLERLMLERRQREARYRQR